MHQIMHYSFFYRIDNITKFRYSIHFEIITKMDLIMYLIIDGDNSSIIILSMEICICLWLIICTIIFIYRM